MVMVVVPNQLSYLERGVDGKIWKWSGNLVGR